MEISVGALVASVRGRIDAANAGDFERVVRPATIEHSGPVVIDCENPAFIGSAGLRAMPIVARTLGRRNAKFALCSVSEPNANIFRIGGFHQLVPVHSSPDEALAADGD